jgi:hypothetical protein
MGGDRADRRPDPVSEEMMEEALAIYRELGDAIGDANVLWGLGGYLLFVGETAAAEERMRRSLEIHRSSGQRTMEAWTLHMLGIAMLMQGRTADAGVPAADALRHFDAVGDVSGITMALDALAVVAAGADDRPRAGRLWGAARQLQESSGTGLADWDAALYADMAIGVRDILDPAELGRLAAEGASLSIGEVVSYALREADPFGDGGSTLNPRDVPSRSRRARRPS